MSGAPITDVQTAFRECRDLEKQLRALLKSKAADKAKHSVRISLRDTYVSILRKDAEFAAAQDIESSLWKYVFYKRIEDYRIHLRQLQQKLSKHPDADGGTMEKFGQRKDMFRKFLMETKKFYEDLYREHLVAALVSKTAANFEDRLLANPDGTVPDSTDLRRMNLALHTCHRCLVFMGDLERYHQLNEGAEQRDWRWAESFYEQALELIPDNGNPHNQLAVSATYMSKDFLSVYRYYRALAVSQPFSTARQNLKLVFDKNHQKLLSLVGITGAVAPARGTSATAGSDTGASDSSAGALDLTEANLERVISDIPTLHVFIIKLLSILYYNTAVGTVRSPKSPSHSGTGAANPASPGGTSGAALSASASAAASAAAGIAGSMSAAGIAAGSSEADFSTFEQIEKSVLKALDALLFAPVRNGSKNAEVSSFALQLLVACFFSVHHSFSAVFPEGMMPTNVMPTAPATVQPAATSGAAAASVTPDPASVKEMEVDGKTEASTLVGALDNKENSSSTPASTASVSAAVGAAAAVASSSAAAGAPSTATVAPSAGGVGPVPLQRSSSGRGLTVSAPSPAFNRRRPSTVSPTSVHSLNLAAYPSTRAELRLSLACVWLFDVATLVVRSVRADNLLLLPVVGVICDWLNHHQLFVSPHTPWTQSDAEKASRSQFWTAFSALINVLSSVQPRDQVLQAAHSGAFTEVAPLPEELQLQGLLYLQHAYYYLARFNFAVLRNPQAYGYDPAVLFASLRLSGSRSNAPAAMATQQLMRLYKIHRFAVHLTSQSTLGVLQIDSSTGECLPCGVTASTPSRRSSMIIASAMAPPSLPVMPAIAVFLARGLKPPTVMLSGRPATPSQRPLRGMPGVSINTGSGTSSRGGVPVIARLPFTRGMSNPVLTSSKSSGSGAPPALSSGGSGATSGSGASPSPFAVPKRGTSPVLIGSRDRHAYRGSGGPGAMSAQARMSPFGAAAAANAAMTLADVSALGASPPHVSYAPDHALQQQQHSHQQQHQHQSGHHHHMQEYDARHPMSPPAPLNIPDDTGTITMLRGSGTPGRGSQRILEAGGHTGVFASTPLASSSGTRVLAPTPVAAHVRHRSPSDTSLPGAKQLAATGTASGMPVAPHHRGRSPSTPANFGTMAAGSTSTTAPSTDDWPMPSLGGPGTGATANTPSGGLTSSEAFLRDNLFAFASPSGASLLRQRPGPSATPQPSPLGFHTSSIAFAQSPSPQPASADQVSGMVTAAGSQHTAADASAGGGVTIEISAPTSSGDHPLHQQHAGAESRASPTPSSHLRTASAPAGSPVKPIQPPKPGLLKTSLSASSVLQHSSRAAGAGMNDQHALNRTHSLWSESSRSLPAMTTDASSSSPPLFPIRESSHDSAYSHVSLLTPTPGAPGSEVLKTAETPFDMAPPPLQGEPVLLMAARVPQDALLAHGDLTVATGTGVKQAVTADGAKSDAPQAAPSTVVNGMSASLAAVFASTTPTRTTPERKVRSSPVGASAEPGVTAADGSQSKVVLQHSEPQAPPASATVEMLADRGVELYAQSFLRGLPGSRTGTDSEAEVHDAFRPAGGVLAADADVDLEADPSLDQYDADLGLHAASAFRDMDTDTEGEHTMYMTGTHVEDDELTGGGPLEGPAATAGAQHHSHQRAQQQHHQQQLEGFHQFGMDAPYDPDMPPGRRDSDGPLAEDDQYHVPASTHYRMGGPAVRPTHERRLSSDKRPSPLHSLRKMTADDDHDAVGANSAASGLTGKVSSTGSGGAATGHPLSGVGHGSSASAGYTPESSSLPLSWSRARTPSPLRDASSGAHHSHGHGHHRPRHSSAAAVPALGPAAVVEPVDDSAPSMMSRLTGMPSLYQTRTADSDPYRHSASVAPRDRERYYAADPNAGSSRMYDPRFHSDPHVSSAAPVGYDAQRGVHNPYAMDHVDPMMTVMHDHVSGKSQSQAPQYQFNDDDRGYGRPNPSPPDTPSRRGRSVQSAVASAATDAEQYRLFGSTAGGSAGHATRHRLNPDAAPYSADPSLPRQSPTRGAIRGGEHSYADVDPDDAAGTLGQGPGFEPYGRHSTKRLDPADRAQVFVASRTAYDPVQSGAGPVDPHQRSASASRVAMHDVYGDHAHREPGAAVSTPTSRWSSTGQGQPEQYESQHRQQQSASPHRRSPGGHASRRDPNRHRQAQAQQPQPYYDSTGANPHLSHGRSHHSHHSVDHSEASPYSMGPPMQVRRSRSAYDLSNDTPGALSGPGLSRVQASSNTVFPAPVGASAMVSGGDQRQYYGHDNSSKPSSGARAPVSLYDSASAASMARSAGRPGAGYPPDPRYGGGFPDQPYAHRRDSADGYDSSMMNVDTSGDQYGRSGRVSQPPPNVGGMEHGNWQEYSSRGRGGAPQPSRDPDHAHGQFYRQPEYSPRSANMGANAWADHSRGAPDMPSPRSYGAPNNSGYSMDPRGALRNDRGYVEDRYQGGYDPRQQQQQQSSAARDRERDMRGNPYGGRYDAAGPDVGSGDPSYRRVDREEPAPDRMRVVRPAYAPHPHPGQQSDPFPRYMEDAPQAWAPPPPRPRDFADHAPVNTRRSTAPVSAMYPPPPAARMNDSSRSRALAAPLAQQQYPPPPLQHMTHPHRSSPPGGPDLAPSGSSLHVAGPAASDQGGSGTAAATSSTAAQ